MKRIFTGLGVLKSSSSYACRGIHYSRKPSEQFYQDIDAGFEKYRERGVPPNVEEILKNARLYEEDSHAIDAEKDTSTTGSIQSKEGDITSATHMQRGEYSFTAKTDVTSDTDEEQEKRCLALVHMIREERVDELKKILDQEKPSRDELLDTDCYNVSPVTATLHRSKNKEISEVMKGYILTLPKFSEDCAKHKFIGEEDEILQTYLPYNDDDNFPVREILPHLLGKQMTNDLLCDYVTEEE
ncbi:hypothetical protein [Candidatus Sneabacter namystus]|uniref:Uncharacterized protein n=1 Tax=Candidatus Sneabacter namystus TaxID=2601646 RepID=A0A5C0UID2_9RICK|nr:hypothetical protein [Candidatus Sneabacter namystus]QEK39361.1 hypothetical protein FZC37_00150 [Candidatus Sneabacter namystus]